MVAPENVHMIEMAAQVAFEIYCRKHVRRPDFVALMQHRFHWMTAAEAALMWESIDIARRDHND